MRKGSFFIYGSVAVIVWIIMTLALFVHRPDMTALGTSTVRRDGSSAIANLTKNIEKYAERLDRQLQDNRALLKSVEILKNERPVSKVSESSKPDSTEKELKAEPDAVIPVLMFACNRVTVAKAIDLLLEYRGTDPEKIRKFPIIVSQDCNHHETASVIRNYGDKIIFMQQPDQSEPEIPKAEKKFKGYFKISRHYGWALNETFVKRFNYNQVIIVEDDLGVSPDFFEYFEATLPLLGKDKSLWCISAWNDNGKQNLIDTNRSDLLYRTDFFGGLGWMLTRELWIDELMQKWPRSYWDDWMRQPAQRRNRACIRPEIPRTKTFGKIGVSNGLFFEKHLKYIHLNDRFYPFTKHDVSYLQRSKYDKMLGKTIADAPAATITSLKSMIAENTGADEQKAVKLFYKTKTDFKAAVKVLGIMDDAKSGVPRMAYRGIVATMYKDVRVFLTPGLNWKGYNPTW